MKAPVLVVIALMAACGAARAQEVAAPAPRTAPDARRDDIRMMESVLTQALQKGAQDLARQLRVNQPNSAFVTGTGRARGFVLDGYGMFFDVDVPGMRQSVVWSAQMVQLMQERERALQDLARLRPEDPLRKIAELQYQQIVRLIAAAQNGSVLVPAPNPAAPTQLAAQGTVNAQNVTSVASESVVTTAPAPAAVPPYPALAASALPAEPRDPNELYTESVKNALIEAMLRYSAFLKLGDGEWLTVAASDSEGPQIPGQLDDTSRIIIRVKGSDLTAFQAGKLTREEVLKRVEVREY